jgi:heat shock protein HtpX
MKRILLFLGTNILVVTTIMIITSLLGVNHYMTAYGLNYSSLAIYCLIWGFVGSFISLMMSKFMAKTMMGVKLVDNSAQYAWLVNKVHQYAKAANLPKMPEVGVYHSPEVNAFATGPSRSNSLVAVSSGLIERMNEDELDGVLAHEVAHIANGDMVTMTLIQGVINAFVLFFAKIAAFALDQALRKNDDSSSSSVGMTYYISQIVFQIIFSILGSIVVMYFSRQREFRADSGGAKLAGKDKMIAALRRLKNNVDLVDDSQSELACMKINGKSKFAALFSSHPSLDSRIAALSQAI